MKNPTILKDELGLLRADRSAVITELRNLSEQLKEAKMELAKQEAAREVVKREIQKEAARLEQTRSRAVFFKQELESNRDESRSVAKKLESLKVQVSLETKDHLGRIKELRDKEEELHRNIDGAKRLFDANSIELTGKIQRRESELASIVKQRDAANIALEEAKKELKSTITEDKKLLKERLKREDKVRAREKNVKAKEEALSKQEEDLSTLASDMTILYGRLKELYAEVKPDIDLDKLITAQP